ncbi:MAG: hypothetical protein LBM96_07795 [Methanobrevibacter sp.]|jgi:hypothetical protein|nr:hypothetical protein [Candidatus Methanoflexus mossambicus]
MNNESNKKNNNQINENTNNTNTNNTNTNKNDKKNINEDLFLDYYYDDEIYGFNDEDTDFNEIEIETDDLFITIGLKKDYGKIKDLNERKKEFKNDINAFFDEFTSKEEFTQFMEIYDIINSNKKE